MISGITNNDVFPQSEEYLTVVYARRPISKADNSFVTVCEELEKPVSPAELKTNTESDDDTFYTACEELDRSELPERKSNVSSNSDDDTFYTACEELERSVSPERTDPSFYPGKFSSRIFFTSRNVGG